MEERDHSSESTPSEAAVIEHEVYARINLLGNPSDVYFGRTISLSGLVEFLGHGSTGAVGEAHYRASSDARSHAFRFS
ncbi:unnamed protein product [Rhodiola kirilowii]